MSIKPNFISKNLEIYSKLHGICNTFKPVIYLLKTYLFPKKPLSFVTTRKQENPVNTAQKMAGQKFNQTRRRSNNTRIKGAVSRNSAKLGNYKMSDKLRET